MDLLLVETFYVSFYCTHANCTIKYVNYFRRKKNWWDEFFQLNNGHIRKRIKKIVSQSHFLLLYLTASVKTGFFISNIIEHLMNTQICMLFFHWKQICSAKTAPRLFSVTARRYVKFYHGFMIHLANMEYLPWLRWSFDKMYWCLRYGLP